MYQKKALYYDKYVFFFSVYLQVQGISLRDPRHVDSTTEVSHKGFARLFLLNFAKFSARCFCHSFSDKVWDFWSVGCNFTKNEVFEQNRTNVLNCKWDLYSVKYIYFITDADVNVDLEISKRPT